MRPLTPALAAAALALAAQTTTGYADTAAQLPSASSISAPLSSGRQPTPLATSAADLVFSGETQTRNFLFVAQPEQTAGAIRLVLSVQSAISDDPDNSRMAVRINDHDLGTLPFKSGAPHMVEVAVPPGVVQPGYNVLNITVDQTHRVDCSIAATYELWTRIDPTLSGIAYGSAAGAKDDFGSIIAMARTDNGATDVRGRLAAGSTEADRNALMTAIEALTIAAGFDRPMVDFSAQPGTGPGVDVIVGTPSAVAAMLGKSGIDAPLHEGVNFAHAANDSRAFVAVVGQDADDINRQIEDLANYGARMPAAGTPQALSALADLRGLPVMPGDKVTLARLGIADRSFSGRHFHQTVHFSMPEDFYPADYARAGLHLDALYARELADGAQLQVELNGKTVSTIGLGGSRNGVIKDQVLPISLSAFRPGLNTLTVDAVLPRAADQTCAALHVADGGRLRIQGTSYLEVPDIARVGRFPDLATLPATLADRTPADRPVDVLVTDSASLNAAGTLLAKLAFTSNRLIDAHLDIGGTYDPSAPTLALGSFGSIPQDVASAVNVDLNDVTSGIGAPGPGLGDPNGSELAQPTNSSLLDAVETRAAWAGDAAQTMAGETIRQARQALIGLGNSLGVRVDFLRYGDWAQPALELNPGTALLIAEQANAAGKAPVVIVATPNAAQLQAAVDELVAGRTWDRLGGSVMTLSDKGEVLQQVGSSGPQLFITRPLTFGNGRLIMAGWLSNNPPVYVLLMVVFATLLGITTWLVLRFGRRKSR